MKMLEAWGDIERRHIVDVSALKDHLHAVVCMIPLIEGAKVKKNVLTLESNSSRVQPKIDLVNI